MRKGRREGFPDSTCAIYEKGAFDGKGLGLGKKREDA